MRNQKALAMSTVVLLSLAGCGPRQGEAPVEQSAPAVTESAPAPTPEPAAPVSAVAALTGADGTEHGTVTFTQAGDLTTVVAHVTGAPPGLHGFHVHETGECTSPDFESAGGHFNPAGAIHGSPSDPDHHAGDLGNVQIAADGTGHLELETNLITVEPGPGSVVGKAVILHEDEDDFVSQPTGAAGGRLACGVVDAGAATAVPEPMEEVENEDTI